MAKGNTTPIHLHCKGSEKRPKCNHINGSTQINKRNTPKLEKKRYCKMCRDHTLHKSKEAKS